MTQWGVVTSDRLKAGRVDVGSRASLIYCVKRLEVPLSEALPGSISENLLHHHMGSSKYRGHARGPELSSLDVWTLSRFFRTTLANRDRALTAAHW